MKPMFLELERINRWYGKQQALCDVSLRLEVYPEGQASVVESIRVISTTAPPTEPLKPVAIERPPTVQKPKNPVRPASASPVVDKAPKAAPVTEPPALPEIELPRPERRR